MPTPLPPAPPCPEPQARHARAWAVAGGLVWALSAVQAHEVTHDPLPAQPGYQVDTAVAVVLPAADGRWPTAGWSGVLLSGVAPPDQRKGLRLEHATLGLAMRLNQHLGLVVTGGWHDRDRAHTEEAALHARWAIGDGELALRAGRATVGLGPAVDGAGHFDRFSQAPLAKRAVLNGPWIDDGVAVGWRGADGDGLRSVELGLWRGRSFPGGPAGPVAPSLQVQAGWGAWAAQLAAAHLEPQARGSAASGLGGVGHVHGSLDCRVSLLQRVCVDGQVDVVGASLQWRPEQGPWQASVTGLLRDERGALYTGSGEAQLRSRVAGGWADVWWQAQGPWSAALRWERLVPQARLEGLGTAALASAAGLADARPVNRLSGALQWQALPQLVLSVEAGHERQADSRVSHLGVRAVWRSERLLSGRW